MKLDGWNWEDAAQKEDDGIHLTGLLTLYNMVGGQSQVILKNRSIQRTNRCYRYLFSKGICLSSVLRKSNGFRTLSYEWFI